MSKGPRISPVESRSLSLSNSVHKNYLVLTISPFPRDDENDEVDCMAESLEAKIERLGRERPHGFKTIWSEIAFVFSITMSQLLTEYFVSGFTVILPTLIRDLNIPEASSVWPATGFSCCTQIVISGNAL